VPEILALIKNLKKDVSDKIEKRKFHEALAIIWNVLSYGDKYMNDKKPWSLKDEEQKYI
jgi:methionyl-tRNA synthetase